MTEEINLNNESTFDLTEEEFDLVRRYIKKIISKRENTDNESL